MTRTMLSVQATPDVSQIRAAKLFQQEYTVIPCVALVEGVLWSANAPAPELALAEEFGRFPDGWNGRPVVYDHPKDSEGMAISAGSPDVLEAVAFGELFNTRLDGNKLKTEIWINNSRVSSLPEEAQEVIAELQRGEGMAEVSTGLFTMSEVVEGTYDGQKFSAVWRNIVPDHLAVLPKGIKGACSIEDGCGAPRMNQMSQTHSVMRAAQLNPTSTQASSDTLQIWTSQEAASAGGCPCKSLQGVTQEEMSLLKKLKSLFSAGSDDSAEEIVPSENAGDESTINIQENAMKVEELVNGLIANEGTQLTEDDREWLSALNEEQLAKLEPAAVEIASEAEEESTEEVATEVVAEELPVAAAAKAVTTDEYIAAAPDEIRAILNSGLRMHRERKTRLIEGLKSNARCKFTAEQLQSKDIEELEYLAELAVIDVSYEGQGATLTANTANDDDEVPPAPLVFSTQNADAA